MEFIETIEKSLGKVAEKSMLPMQDGDVVSTFADTTELENNFGYKPNTELKVGVGKFVNWYENFYDV
jgi:UDP-glucuronate 4-epimerase